MKRAERVTIDSLALPLVVLLVMSGSLWAGGPAQQPAGIFVHVDDNGPNVGLPALPLPGATLTLIGPDGKKRAFASTEGDYEFFPLAAGPYYLAAELPGWQESYREVSISPGQCLQFEMVIGPFAAAGKVDISSGHHFHSNPKLDLLAPQWAVIPFTISPTDYDLSTYDTHSLHELFVLLEPAVAEARKIYPAAKARLLAGLPEGDLFFVTAQLKDYWGRITDQFFVLVDHMEAEKIVGPVWTHHPVLYTYGQRQVVTIPEEDIVDWVILHKNGNEEGNYIGKAMESAEKRLVDVLISGSENSR